jgi:hypothetical protein
MQFEPSEQLLPLPFILLADACEEMTGAGIERVKIANATAVTAERISFIVNFLSGKCNSRSIHPLEALSISGFEAAAFIHFTVGISSPASDAALPDHCHSD